MNLLSAASRYCPPLREITFAPLVCALALLGIGGLTMNRSIKLGEPAEMAGSAAPVSETTGKVLPVVNFRVDAAGTVYHQGDEITEDDISASGKGEESAVIVHVEEGAPAQALMKIMRWLKAAGVKHTAVETGP